MSRVTPTWVLRTIAGIGVTVAAYAAFAAITWLQYGEEIQPAPGEEDPLLDRFMPLYEVVELHHVHVAAPAAVTFAAAKEQEGGSLLDPSAIAKPRTFCGSFRAPMRGLASDTNAAMAFLLLKSSSPNSSRETV